MVTCVMLVSDPRQISISIIVVYCKLAFFSETLLWHPRDNFLPLLLILRDCKIFIERGSHIVFIV